MAKTSGNGARSVFSRWLRTGQVPSALSPDGLERKFNPWHDTADGRFTFANTGRHYGAGGADTTEGKSRRTPAGGSRAPANGDHARSRIATPSTAETEAPRTGGPVGHAQPSVARGAVGTQSPRMTRSPPRNQPNPEAEFIGGATGAVTGNVALAVVPGAALSKVSAVRRLRMAKPRPTDDPPQIGWVKELCGKRMYWHSIASWEHGTFRPPRKRRRASSC